MAEPLVEPSQEPEVLAAYLKQIGCPYTIPDLRIRVWLDGYRAGLKGGEKIAKEVIAEIGEEMRKGEGQ